MIHLVLADGTDVAPGAVVDHGYLSAVTDLTIDISDPTKTSDRKRKINHSITTFVEMDPADARIWSEFGVERTNFLPRSDELRTKTRWRGG